MKHKVYQLNDRTAKYLSLKQGKRLHRYLGIPGEYDVRYPQEIVFPNMDAGRVDEYYSTKEGFLVNLEEESGNISLKTFEKFGKYAIFGEFMYSKKLYLAVICHKDPKNFPKWYEKSPSIYIKPHYYYFSQKELWERYENIINKVEQKRELTEMEALDIAFIPKFIDEKNAPFVTESLAKIMKSTMISDEELKRDVVILLGARILKNIDDPRKQNKLMEEIGMKQAEDEIKILARDEFGEELEEIENENLKLQKEINEVKKENNEMKKENNEMKKENNKMKENFKKINKIKDLNPEVRKIINSMTI